MLPVLGFAGERLLVTTIVTLDRIIDVETQMKDLNYVEEQLNLLLLRITWSVIPAVFFFLVDVSMNAVKTGATSAASSAISQAIADVHAANLAMKSTGGKLLVFQSVLPLIGFGALSTRGIEGRSNISAGEKVQEAHKLLQPADKMLKTMAIEFAEFQVSVDIFITTQTYVDIASISVVPRTTGGQVYYYHPFSAVSDSAKLYNDLRWNVSRLQRLEAVMRVRCSQGLQVQEYLGNFCKRIPTDADLPAIDCDNGDLQT